MNRPASSPGPLAPSAPRRLLDGLYALSAGLAALSVFLIFVLMICASLGRMFNWRVGGINDIVAWLCAAAAFFAMASAFRNGDFVRVTLFMDHASPGRRRVMEVGSLLVASLAIGYLLRWAAAYTWESYEFNDIAGGMVALPLWIPQTSFVIGAALLLLAVLDELFTALRGEKPAYQRALEERHARGDYSSDL